TSLFRSRSRARLRRRRLRHGGRAVLQCPTSLLADLFGSHAHLVEDVNRHALIMAHQRQQEMLRSNIMMAHTAGLFDCEFKYALGTGREVQLGDRRPLAGPGATLSQLLYTKHSLSPPPPH